MRNNVLDIIKGFAIFLVVVGHLIQNSIACFGHNLLWRFIYSFHMPLFFFVSGFLAYISKKEGLELLYKRFNSLIIPFFIWTIIYYFTNGNYEKIGLLEYILGVVMVPDKSLWFLWVLFFCFLLLSVAKKIPINLYVSLILLGIILLTFSIVIQNKILGINLISKQFPFFFLGYLTNNYKEYIFDYLWKYRLIVLLLFISGASCWMQKEEDPLFYKFINLGPLFKLGYIFIVGFLGILSSFILFMKTKDNSTNKFYWLLSYFGKHTLAVYTIHFLVLDFFKLEYTNSFLYYSLVFLYASFIMMICLLIEYLISFNSIVFNLLFGIGNQFKKIK